MYKKRKELCVNLCVSEMDKRGEQATQMDRGYWLLFWIFFLKEGED